MIFSNRLVIKPEVNKAAMLFLLVFLLPCHAVAQSVTGSPLAVIEPESSLGFCDDLYESDGNVKSSTGRCAKRSKRVSAANAPVFDPATGFAFEQSTAPGGPVEKNLPASKQAPVEVEVFRNSVVSYLIDLQIHSQDGGEAGNLAKLIDNILLADAETIEVWFKAVPQVETFINLLESRHELPAPRASKLASDSAGEYELSASPGPVVQSGGPMDDDGFWPAYGPNSGPYSEILSILVGTGFLPPNNPSNLRCDTDLWATQWKKFEMAQAASNGLEVICMSASCDPIGLGCIAACGAASLAVATKDFLERPLLYCDAHEGFVDSVEIEAGFENSRILVRNVAHVHDDLEETSEDLEDHIETMRVRAIIAQENTDNIRADIAAHNVNIDGDLAVHDLRLENHDANIDDDLVQHDAEMKSQLTVHDGTIKYQLATHDAEIKARLGNIQATIDENQRLIKVSMSRQAEIMRLMITPEGKRNINPAVLTCTGDNCPTVEEILGCDEENDWACK